MSTSKFIQTVVAVLCIAAIAGWYLRPLRHPASWAIVGVVAVALGYLRARPGGGTGTGGASFLGGGSFLCDRCKYNHPNTCGNPERPNATRCDEFRARGE